MTQDCPEVFPKLFIYCIRRQPLLRTITPKLDDGYGALGIKAKLWDLGRIEADLSYRHREVDDFFVSSSFKDKRDLSTWGFTPKYILEKPLWTFE